VETAELAAMAVPAVELQLGHGLSTVETRSSLNCVALVPRMLQLGHGLSTVETAAGDGSRCPGRRASIGPRPFDRGNHTLAADNHDRTSSFNWATAFRPWKRGLQPSSSCRRLLLQLGHGLSTVETGRWPSSPDRV